MTDKEIKRMVIKELDCTIQRLTTLRKSLSDTAPIPKPKPSPPPHKVFGKDSNEYLLAEYLFNRVLENYPNYRKKEHSTEALVEKKLQGWAEAISLVIRIDKRTVVEIMEVIDWTQNDPFWRQNIKSPSKLREKFEDLLIRIEEDPKISRTVNKGSRIEESDDSDPDPDPELTKKIVKAYGLLINNDGYKPTNVEIIKFIKTTKKMLEFYKDRSIIRVNWIKYMVRCLEKNYGDKGETMFPGHMCGDHTWNVLMPQFLSELGI